MKDNNNIAQQSIENIRNTIGEIDVLIAKDGSPQRIAELQEVRIQLVQVLTTIEHNGQPKEHKLS